MLDLVTAIVVGLLVVLILVHLIELNRGVDRRHSASVARRHERLLREIERH